MYLHFCILYSYPDNEESLDWFLPPAPLVLDIPDTQQLEEEIESHELLDQKKRPKMLTSNLKITNEDENYILPIQKFQCAFPYNKYEKDDHNLEGTGNNDLSHAAGKLTYGSSQKYKNYIGTEIAPEKNSPVASELVSFVEDKEECASAFRKRLFKISDSVHGSAYCNDSTNLDSHIGSVKMIQTEMNKGKAWKCNNIKQKPPYSTNMFIGNNAFSASKIGDSILKASSISVAFQSQGIQVAPIKALCSQRFDDWKGKFGPIGLNCKELTGDTVMDDLFEIQHAHIIMTTPEKWDSMTRKWRDNSLVQLVRLFLIDEVHAIKDENRGPTLEVVVSRMKTVQSLSQTLENTSTVIPMRFVAVSATIPNAEDIAEWLSDGERPAVCLKMDESHRPVKLRKVVLGFPCASNQTEFKFDLTLNYKIASVIQTYSDQKPTLVFCATRKGVQQAASVLVKDTKFILTVEQKQRLQKCACSIRDSKLRDILTHGVAYHHAGMELSDRKVVEGAFTVGDLPVLFTTSTLAMGVNLPAHLVVIKSTMHYVGGMFEEYSETDILQMIGRAGRPQLPEVYKKPVKLKQINSILTYTGFKSGLNKDGIEAKLQEAGRLMAWYYITFETVKKFCTISGKETLSDLIARYGDTMAEILVTVILRNFEQLQTKRTAPDSHYVTLIIGDADNQVVFKHKIMDSVLLRGRTWTKKIDVKRALKSEELNINLISSEFVGLDIQQKFTVFFLGPKRFGNQIIMQRKSETEISHSKHSDKSAVAGPNKEQWDQYQICGKVQQEPSEYQDKEVLNVNFELGNEVWDDFDDDNLIDVTSFSANTEETKTSAQTMRCSTKSMGAPNHSPEGIHCDQHSQQDLSARLCVPVPDQHGLHELLPGLHCIHLLGEDIGQCDWGPGLTSTADCLNFGILVFGILLVTTINSFIIEPAMIHQKIAEMKKDFEGFQ
ncbi:putative ATP-dependent DNA helicase HFM1 [Tupaia chinensis]|uniref:DNA 3'-5' helicase n=1 Tax=Tupaia chinensis TaxID=246437 RepID=L9LCH0_TUPCH|nr:putative ATP-dependent DNA helicase HFM1 [Tupaia chinensis]